MTDPTYYLDINGLSKHIGGKPYDYNERNPGLGLTRETEANGLVKGLMAGGYKNSFGDPSYYLGGHLAKRFGNDYYLDAGVSGGLITGYDNQAITPMAALMAQVGKKGLGRLKFQYVPSIEAKQPALWMVNAGIPIGDKGKRKNRLAEQIIAGTRGNK